MLHRVGVLVVIALAAGAADARAAGEPPVCNGGRGSDVVRAGTVRNFGPSPCYDRDGDPFRYEIVRPPAHGRVDPVNLGGPEFLRYTPDASGVAGVRDSFAYRAVETGLLGQASEVFEQGVRIVAPSFNTAPGCFFTPISRAGGLHRDDPLEVETGEVLDLYSRCVDDENDPFGAAVVEAPHGRAPLDALGANRFRIDPGFDPGPDGTEEVVTATYTDNPPAPAQPQSAAEEVYLRLVRADHDPVCPVLPVLVPEGVEQVPITVRCEDADPEDAMRMRVFVPPPSGTLTVADGQDGSSRSLDLTYTFAPGSSGAWTQILAEDGRVVDGRFVADDSASALVMIERATPAAYVAQGVAPSVLDAGARSTRTPNARRLAFPVGPYPTAVRLRVALRTRGRTLGTRTLALTAGAERRLRVRLSAAGRKLVKRPGALPATLRVTATDVASGATSTTSRRVRLR